MNIRQNTSLLRSINNNVSQNKVFFTAKLTNGTYEYLPQLDYSSTPIVFYWDNNKDNPVYITKYRFMYQHDSEPTYTEMYHGTAFTTKIGLIENTLNNTFEAPYIELSSNLEFTTRDHNSNEPKKSWLTDTCWCFTYDFKDAPMKIDNDRRFGHYIANDFTGESYGSNPIGIVEGYYLA